MTSQWRQSHRGTPPPKHGLNGYQNYGCRCDVCRDASTARRREQARAAGRPARVLRSDWVNLPHEEELRRLIHEQEVDARHPYRIWGQFLGRQRTASLDADLGRWDRTLMDLVADVGQGLPYLSRSPKRAFSQKTDADLA